MSPIALALAAVLVVAAFAFVRELRRRAAPLSAEERAELALSPMTPLQKGAWWSLLVGLAMILACVAVITSAGPAAYFEDGDLRLLVLAFIFVAMAAWLRLLLLAARRGGAALDERDRRVLMFAPHVQTAAVLVTVAAWSTALTLGFRGEGIPTDYMYLMFWSVFLMLMVSYSAGILVGYRLGRIDGEG